MNKTATSIITIRGYRYKMLKHMTMMAGAGAGSTLSIAKKP
jgi:hypothetical protein